MYHPLLPHSPGTLLSLRPAPRLAVPCCAVVFPCRLCIWRLVRAIQQRPPPVELRRTLGPGFVSSRNPGGDIAYNRNNPPVAPSYLGAEVVAKWAARVPFNVLAGYCTELGLVQVSGGQGRGGVHGERGLCVRSRCALLEEFMQGQRSAKFSHVLQVLLSPVKSSFGCALVCHEDQLTNPLTHRLPVLSPLLHPPPPATYYSTRPGRLHPTWPWRCAPTCSSRRAHCCGRCSSWPPCRPAPSWSPALWG